MDQFGDVAIVAKVDGYPLALLHAELWARYCPVVSNGFDDPARSEFEFQRC